ncbi:hypothetical protein CLOM_g14461 [Closterium sp. NIES-68]|nr:hypothetical protein CLOM_g14461 [Closterium sp. NIES-68]GJP59869.1 hypothetical protein CLOP_g15663 [Closterium sp. NIES-67]
MEEEARLLLSIERSILSQSCTYFATLLSSFREASLPALHIRWQPALFALLLPHLLPGLLPPSLSAPHIPGLLASAVYFGVPAAVRAANQWAHRCCSAGGRGEGGTKGERAGVGSCTWVCFPPPVSDVQWLTATWNAACDAGACCVQHLCAVVTAVELPHLAHHQRHGVPLLPRSLLLAALSTHRALLNVPSEQWLCEVLLWWALGQQAEGGLASTGEGGAQEGRLLQGEAEREGSGAEGGEEEEDRSELYCDGYVYMLGVHGAGSAHEVLSSPQHSQRPGNEASSLLAHVEQSLLPPAFLQSPLGRLFRSVAATDSSLEGAGNEQHGSTWSGGSCSSSVGGQGRESSKGLVCISPWTQAYSFAGCSLLHPDAFLSSSASLSRFLPPAPPALPLPWEASPQALPTCALSSPPLSSAPSSPPPTLLPVPHLPSHTLTTSTPQHPLPLPPSSLLAHLDVSRCPLLLPLHLHAWASASAPPPPLRRLTACSCPALLPIPTLRGLASSCPELHSVDLSMPEPPVFCRGVVGPRGGVAAVPCANDGDCGSKGAGKKAHKAVPGASRMATRDELQAKDRAPSAVSQSQVQGRHGRSSAGQGRRGAHMTDNKRMGGGGEEEAEEAEEEDLSGEGSGSEGVRETASMLVPLHLLYNPWRLKHLTSLSLRWQQQLSDEHLMELVLACPALARLDITGCGALSDRAIAALITSYTRAPPTPACRAARPRKATRRQKGSHPFRSENPPSSPLCRSAYDAPRCHLQLSHVCAAHTLLSLRSLHALSSALMAAAAARGGTDGDDDDDEEDGEEEEEDEEEEDEEEEEEEEVEEEDDGGSEGDEEQVRERKREGRGHIDGIHCGLRKLQLDGCPALRHSLPLLQVLSAASSSLTHLSLSHTHSHAHAGEAAAHRDKGRGGERKGGANKGDGCLNAVDDAFVAKWLDGARTMDARGTHHSSESSSGSRSSDVIRVLPHLTHLNVSDAPLSASGISALCIAAPRLHHLLITGCCKPTPPLPSSSSAPPTTITIPLRLATLHASWALPLSLSIPPPSLTPPVARSSDGSPPPPPPRAFPLRHCLRALCVGLGATISDASLRAIAALCPRLTALTLTFQPVSDDGILPLLASCPLRHLALLHCWGPFSPLLFSPSPLSVHISLSHSTHHAHHPASATHGTRPLPLSSLSLSGGFAWLSSPHLPLLAAAAPLLRSLSLSACPSLSHDAPLILVNSFPALTSLTLTECPNLFTHYAPSSLFALSALSSLHVRHTGKQAPANFIQQAAGRLPALQHLSLDLCDAVTSSFHVPHEGREDMHVMGSSLLVVRLFKCHVPHTHAHSLTTLASSEGNPQKRTLGTKDVLVIVRTPNGISTSVENVS